MTAPPDCDPNWRDDPAELDQLCEEGARDLYGGWIPYRNTVTVAMEGDYL